MSERAFSEGVLLTGGTGYLGRLTAGRLLAEGVERLVLPVREHHDPAKLLAAIGDEMLAAGTPLDDAARARVAIVPLPAIARTEELVEVCHGVGEILHCAASMDYFDAALAEEVNVEWTRRLVAVARAAGHRRFVYVSTAFSCGLASGAVAEALHDEPCVDATVYTKSKRAAEHVVAAGGVPFLIIRPSVIIGHSATGRYSGGVFGLYQLWAAALRFLTGEYHRVLHMVAPRIPAPVLHSDAYLDGLVGACRRLEDGAVVHLISDPRRAPTMASLARAFLEEHFGPREIVLHERYEKHTVADFSPAERLAAEYVSVNLEILQHRLDLEHERIDLLKSQGMRFVDATLDTVRACERAFVGGSERLARYRARFRHLLARNAMVRFSS